MKYYIVVVCMMCVLGWDTLWAAQDHIGSIKTLSGTVVILREGRDVQPALGTRLFTRDTIKTGPDGSAGIILQDDTVVSLGHDSELSLKEFRFDPMTKDFSLISRMVSGTFVFVSGLIGKLSPASVRIETPDGIVAIRGTKFVAHIQE